MRINNNVTAMNAHRQYGINNASIGKNVEKLSSGYRINRAGDDAAGLAISEKMRAQIKGLTMASKNSQDGISLIQTAEGALQSTHNVLQRMRELAVQSASDTNETSIDRGALNKEFQALKSEIDDTALRTRFNDQNLIDGTFASYKQSATVSTDAATSVNRVLIGDAKSGSYELTSSVRMVGAEAGKETTFSASKGSSDLVKTAEFNATDSTGAAASLGSLNTDKYNKEFSLSYGGIDADGIAHFSLTAQDGTKLDGTLDMTKGLDGSSFDIDFGQHGTLTVNTSTAQDVGGYVAAADDADVAAAQTAVDNAQDAVDNDPKAKAVSDAKDALKTAEDNKASLESLLSKYGALGTVSDIDDVDSTVITDSDDLTEFGRLVTDAGITTGISVSTMGGALDTIITDAETDLDTAETALKDDADSQQLISDLADAQAALDKATAGASTVGGGENAKKLDQFGKDLVGVAVTGVGGKEDVAGTAKAFVSLGNEEVEVFAGDQEVEFHTAGVTLVLNDPLSEKSLHGEDAQKNGKIDGFADGASSTIDIVQQKGKSLVLQTGANEGDNLAINVDKMNTNTLGIYTSKITTREAASSAISSVNTAINKVSSQRADLGALQNRLEFKISNLDTSAENLQAAESRIRDVDMAKEMTQFSKNNILAQASTSMLAQANSLPQSVLKLLG